MAKFIRIQSTVTINVTPGLQHQDVTNPDAHVPDRLRIAATWPKACVLIRQGVGTYPAEIAEWDTVKALANNKVLTITDATESEITEEVKAASAALSENMAEAGVVQKKKRSTSPSLDTIAGE